MTTLCSWKNNQISHTNPQTVHGLPCPPSNLNLPLADHTPATLASCQFPEQPKPLPCLRTLMLTASFPRTHWLSPKSQLKHFSSEKSSLTTLSKLWRIKCALFHFLKEYSWNSKNGSQNDISKIHKILMNALTRLTNISQGKIFS